MFEQKIREDIIDGMGPWYWPKDDHGAWDGPVSDWKSHKATIEFLKERRTVIQAGGCCGLYPALLSDMFEKVLTFEPDRQNYHFLNINCQGKNNISSYPFALGAEDKHVSMNNSDRTNVGTHSVNDEPGEVLMMKIDGFLYDDEIIDLIWLDLEGYEYNALLGAVETIKVHKPMIGVERASGEVITLLSDLGYGILSNSEMDTFFVHKDKR